MYGGKKKKTHAKQLLYRCLHSKFALTLERSAKRRVQVKTLTKVRVTLFKQKHKTRKQIKNQNKKQIA